MADRGAFEGVDAAMMVHPAGADLSRMDVIAIQQLWVDYHGKAAHAAAFPQKGRNALDAAVLGYMNVAALRQHIRPTERVHGIFPRAGDKPNIVPELASAQWYVRSPTLKTLERLKPRVFACLEAGAAAAGCEMTHEWQEPGLRRHGRQRADARALRRERGAHGPHVERPARRARIPSSAAPTWATCRTSCRRSTR